MDNGLVQTGFLQSMPSVEVLILVVVDNGLVPTMANVTINGLDGVLILVVVDNGLVLSARQIADATERTVLILVVVDNGLVLDTAVFKLVNNLSLNPCCSGQWSRTVCLILEKLYNVMS